eukprot:EG_transcript_3131
MDEHVLKAQLEVLRTELEIKKREAELARLHAQRGRPEPSRARPLSPPPARPASYRPPPGDYYSQPPPPKRPRVEQPRTPYSYSAQTPQRTSPARTGYGGQYVRPSAVPSRQVVGTSPAARQKAAPKEHKDSLLQQVQKMRLRLEKDVPPGGMLVQYATILMFEAFKNHQPPSPEALAELQLAFSNFLERVRAGMEAGQQDVWAPIGQQIKLFFEAGFRIRKHFDFKQGQQPLFLAYVDALNLFMPLPEDVPADFQPHAACWLRPTLALGCGVLDAVRLQSGVIPETLSPSDLLAELYWDLEVDVFQKEPKESLPQATVARRKRNVTQIALSILQNSDFASFQPKEGTVKSPPIVIVCHSKGMVLKLADTLNYLARFEYSQGYRGAEAAYREAVGLSDPPVSIVVCTTGRALNELQKGGLSFQSLKLLAFMAQGTMSAQEMQKIRNQAPVTSRIMVFHSQKMPIKNGLEVLSGLLRASPLRLLWEGPNVHQFHAEEILPPRAPTATVTTPTPPIRALVHAPLTPAAVDPAPARAGPPLVIQPVAAAARTPKGPPIQPATIHSGPAGLIDFACPELDPRIPEALRLHPGHPRHATPLQQLVVPQMMTGESRVFISPDEAGIPLAFVVPTVHLMLNYPSDPTVRVLVLAARIEDVDAVVAEYQGLMAALPDAGLTAEGIHSKRFTFYETPVNTAANVIVGTTAKLANILRGQEKNVTIDVGSVDVLVLYKLNFRSRGELRDALDIHGAIRAARGGVQVVAFVPPSSASAVDDLTADLCAGAIVIPFEG